MSLKAEDAPKAPKGRQRAASLKGAFIGNYELLQTIGEGSFAKVKLARHRLTHQKVIYDIDI
jgi:MAP/microtubule affinity-regulating kinase